ncbi:MAG: hypothetical protein JW795_23530 [Chitinivibrionales bacterium]|nr:hypothetical protein [Chitinivibrionales bacterium]
MDTLSNMSQKAKTFWDRPEGKVGAVVAAGVGVGLLILLYRMLPTLIKLAENTLYLVFLLASIGIIAYLVLDPRNRALFFYMYRSVMRWVTGMFIQLDPIAILKTYIESLKNNLTKMDEQIRKLRGTMTTLKRSIDENERTAMRNMEMASEAKERGKSKIMILQARKAGRLKQSNLTLKNLYVKIEILYRVLAKMYENCGILLEDTEDQVKIKEAEWKAVQQSHRAMKSAMSMINGNKDQRAIYEQALEFMVDDIGNKIGEMERFMELSESFMDGVDIQNGIFEEKGLEMLEKWEKDADSLILGEQKTLLIEQANNPAAVIDLNATPSSVKSPLLSTDSRANQFSKLFNEN